MFVVDNNVFDRYVEDQDSVPLRTSRVQGLFVAIEEVTCRAMVAYIENGIVRCMPYTDFFALVKTPKGERPLFMPLTKEGQPHPFNDGDRQWNPEIDLGMVV